MNDDLISSPEWEQAIDIAKALISIKSTSMSPNKEEIFGYASNCLGDLDTKVVTPDGVAPYLIARTPRRKGGFRVLLSGHLDTVDANEMENPFSAIDKNGSIHGRGSADMKGGCAAMMQAIIEFAKLKKPKGEVCLILTSDEEIGSSGIIKALQTEDLHADLAIVGEPSDFSLIVAHRGNQWIKAAFHGRSCHSGKPECGQNAVLMATRFIQEMEAYVTSCFSARRHPLCGVPTMTVGGIQGGSPFANVVPSHCEITIDRRWNPNETIDQVKEDMNRILAECQRKYPGFSASIEYGDDGVEMVYPPLDFSGQTTLLQRIGDAIEESGLPRPPHSTFCGWTEGALLEKNGTPAVIFGPGDLNLAHTLEERIEKAQIVSAAKAYYSILRKCCT